MFDDRRNKQDRRQYHLPELIPASGCRRAARDRRDRYRRYRQPLPWWLQTNYAEEMEPPLLDDGSASSARADADPRLLQVWIRRRR